MKSLMDEILAPLLAYNAFISDKRNNPLPFDVWKDEVYEQCVTCGEFHDEVPFQCETGDGV